MKRQHQRIQRTKKLDVAKLANNETQDTLRDNVASALEDLVDTEYEDAASHWAEPRSKTIPGLSRLTRIYEEKAYGLF